MEFPSNPVAATLAGENKSTEASKKEREIRPFRPTFKKITAKIENKSRFCSHFQTTVVEVCAPVAFKRRLKTGAIDLLFLFCAADR